VVLPVVAHMIAPDPIIAVVGCGNPNRQDDGVGHQVIQSLKGKQFDRVSVRLLDAGTDGMAVMFSARGCSSLIVVDAAHTGVEAGAIYEVPGAELERPYKHGLNLHDFRWDAALHAGRQIFRDAFPSDVTVFLIEAAELGFGVGLTPAVSRAADKVACRIEALIEKRRSKDVT
jgi:hydrogenase maturation protease